MQRGIACATRPIKGGARQANAAAQLSLRTPMKLANDWLPANRIFWRQTTWLPRSQTWAPRFSPPQLPAVSAVSFDIIGC